MQRLALHVTALASVLGLGLPACGSGSDAGSPSGGAGAGGPGQAGATSGGSASTAGSSAVGGSAAGTQSAGGGGASTGGASPTAGSNSGGAGGSGGSGGSGGGPTQVTGTPLVYVGGFGDFPVRTYELNKATGALTQRGGDTDGGGSPSYLAINPAGTFLYAANEENGQGAGVTAFGIQADGTLKRLNHQQGSDKSCDGSCGFTHVAVDPTGKLLFAASYDGGSVSAFPLNADGSLGSEKSMQDFGGSAYAHSTGFDPSGKFAFVPTKGIDKVQQLKVAADGSLSQNSPTSVSSKGGAGPRHIALHPSGKLMLVMNETDSTMTSYALSAEGTLSSKSTASSLPQGFQGETYGQHVEVSPDGRFVYGSNVGHDSIAVFSLDGASGALGLIQNQPSGGAWPRDFDIDPNGEVLVVANRDSNTLSVLKIGADGKLSPLGTPTTVPEQPSAVVIHYQK